MFVENLAREIFFPTHLTHLLRRRPQRKAGSPAEELGDDDHGVGACVRSRPRTLMSRREERYASGEEAFQCFCCCRRECLCACLCVCACEGERGRGGRQVSSRVQNRAMKSWHAPSADEVVEIRVPHQGIEHIFCNTELSGVG